MIVINMGNSTKEIICDYCNKTIRINLYLDEMKNMEEIKKWITMDFDYDDRIIKKDFCSKKCCDEYTHIWNGRIK